MKILLAVDGSTYTKKMLAYLTTHELFSKGNDFTAFTVQPPLPPRAQTAVGKDIVEKYYADEAEAVLAPVHKFLLRHGIDAKTSWQTGHIGERIAKYAEEENFDLLVLGSHGHGLIANLVMGSVANQVLAQCKIPVLLVR